MVYSNEVDVTATPLQGFQAGQQAVLEAANGKPLDIVALSPNNLICARLLSRDIKLPLDKSLLVHRLNVALSLRERLFDQPCYRLVYGDSDLLPGWWSTASSISSWCNWPRPPWKRTRTT